MSQRVLYTLRIYIACRSCLFVIPVIFNFLDKQGIAQKDWYLLMGIAIAASVLLEVPAGMFADRFGTKPTLVLSTLVSVITLLIFPMFHTFWGMVLPHCCLGITMACDSGTLEAYVHSFDEHTYKKSFGKLQLFSLTGMISFIASGLIVDTWSHATPFYWTACAHAVALLSAIALPSSNSKTASELKTIWKDVVVIRNFHSLLFLISMGMFVSYVAQNYLMLKSINASIQFVGIIIASLQALTVIGKSLAHRVSKNYLVAVLIVLIPLPLAIAGLFPTWLAILCFCLIAVGKGALSIITDDRLMKLTANKASIVSIKSMGVRIYFTIILTSFGVGISVISMPTALTLLALFSLVWVLVHTNTIKSLVPCQQ